MSKDRDILRKKMQKMRTGIDGKIFKDKLMFDCFFNMKEVSGFESFFVYVSMNDEADTLRIIEKLLCLNKKVCIPYTKDCTMSVKRLLELPQNVKTDKLGNIYGADTLSTVDFDCDCAVVPMLAFNNRLFRLGYGGGYYDRFLSTFKGFRLGLAYSEQLNNEFAESCFDEGLDAIVTQNGIIRKRGAL